MCCPSPPEAPLGIQKSFVFAQPRSHDFAFGSRIRHDVADFVHRIAIRIHRFSIVVFVSHSNHDIIRIISM